MMKIHKIIILIGCLTASLGLHAQNISDMRLNEFLVINTDDFEDDYGHKNGWIELFNTSYGTVDVGGCFLTNDPGNLTKYMIPKGDVLTKVKPRQHTLFWADNLPDRGTFHINFRLEDSDEILFVSSDGRTIVDRIKIDHSISSPNVSYGRTNDGIGSTDGSGEGWEIMKKTSPSTNNVILDGESNSMKLKKLDPYGIIMAITAMSVVFVALIILYLMFKWIGKLSIKKHQKRSDDVAKQNDKAEHKFEETSAEAYAAIALALHLYREETELHDVENTILTIEKSKKAYSPWSSKIYMLRETPQLRKRN